MKESNNPPEIMSALKNRNYWGSMNRKNRDEFAENTYKEKKVKVHEMIFNHKREIKSSLTVDGKSDSKERANIFAVNLEKKFSHEDKRHF